LFDSAGGTTAYNVAAWNGASWAAVGGLPNIQTWALLSGDLGNGPELFAAGFNATGSIVARLTGPAWQPLGVFDNAVRALAVFDDGTGPALYAGGSFTMVDGMPASLVARWNGSWTSLGPPGISGTIDALTPFDDGSGPALWAMGFTSPQQPALTSGVVKITGAPWTPVLGPLMGYSSGRVALVPFDDGTGPALYLGATFTAVGSVASCGIAKFGALRPRVEVAQFGGAGGPVQVRNTWLLKNHEYYNVFSDTLCGTAGSGPYLGLCAPNPAPLLYQFGLPLGTAPIHFLAPLGSLTFGNYLLPPGLALDTICFDYTGGILGCVSKVARIIVQ
jgi:hypothetical protein